MLDTLDEGNTISDETNNHLNGTYTGNIQVVPEAKFGSCLYFDGNGDSITVPDKAALRLHNYTAEVWIKPEQTRSNQGVLGKPGRNYNIWLGASGYIHHRFHTENNLNAGVPDTDAGSIVWGQWHHVAITNDGQTARTYINGILKAEGAVTGNLVIDNTPLVVGRSLDDSQGDYYKGCMAHLRLYDDVLTLEEIRRDMLQDESAASAFVRSHPIDFELYNEDNHHVLLIDDHPEGQTLSLDILNSSRQNIELNDLGQTATPQAHHFELRFRPETLARANLAQINVATDGWSLDRSPDGTALYLLHQGLITLEAGKRTSLQLTGMNADGRGGTRGTRMELVYQNMHYAGEESLLDGSRLQYLNIVNRQGRRNIPLHVGFVGSDTVLSDGKTPNTLRLRLANLSRDFDLRLSKGDATTPPSRFRVSFDVQAANETREWALTDYSKVDGASLHVTQTHSVSSNWADPQKRNLGQAVEWTVAPSEDTTLKADGYITLELRDLVALTSIGHANIYINFENIPGYEDQQMTIVVQKSPLLFSNGNVGIGIKEPGSYKLNVEGGDTRLGRNLTVAGILSAQKIVGDGAVVAGMIMMWSGAADKIPAGWVLCDGQNNTPNLIDRFVVGAGRTYSVGATGGADQVTLTAAQMPTHNHDVTDPGHNHSFSLMRHHRSFQGEDADDKPLKFNGGTWESFSTYPQTTGISINNTGSGEAHENRPPYYALCFIMKV
jgi:microcystin-dependent protein